MLTTYLVLLGLAGSGNPAPCGQLLESCHDETPEGQLAWSTFVYDIVQPFHVDGTSICGVRLLVSISSVETADLTVRVQSSAEPLAGVMSETQITITREPAFHWWVDVDLPDVPVIPGSTYYLYVTGENGMWSSAEQTCGDPVILDGRESLSSTAFEIFGGIASPVEARSWSRIKSTFVRANRS